MAELTPGSVSSEFWWIKAVTIGGIVVAIAASLGSVPFTPDQVGVYLTGVMKEAGEWSKVLLPYITGLAGFYAWLRTSLKKKSMGSPIKE